MAGMGDILGGPAAWAFPGVRKGKNSFGSTLFGTPGHVSQTPTYTPQQQASLNQLLSNSMTGLNSNKFDFAPIANQARQNFQQQTLPGIAERFTNMGTSGGQRSSAFAGSLGQAASGLESNLAGMQQQYNLTQQDQLMNMLRMALQPQFENSYHPGHGGLLGGLMGGQGGQGGIMSLLPLLMGL